MIRTVFVVSVTFLYIFVVGIPALIWAFLSGNCRVLYLVGRAGARLSFFLGGMTLDVYGREKLDPSKPCVYIPNHESIIDPVVVFKEIPHDVVALAKKEFFRLPVLGRACRLAGFVSVNRADPEQRRVASLQASRLAREQVKSFVVFGEGTRSRDGRLGAFKKGGAIIAIEAQVPVVPVAVYGGYALWPKGKKFFRPGPVQLHFLDPIDTTGMTFADKDRLTLECRARIAACLRSIDPTRFSETEQALAEEHEWVVDGAD